MFTRQSVVGSLPCLGPSRSCGSVPSPLERNDRNGGTWGLASSTQHHQGDGPTSLLGPVSMDKEQRAVRSGGLVVEVEAAVLLKLGLSPRRVEEVVDELLQAGVCI